LHESEAQVELERALAAMPEWRDVALRVTPITTGITNRNYLVEADEEKFVVRLAGRDTDLLGIDRAAEYEAGRAASAVGVGPQVVRWMPDHGCLVTRFVEGAHIQEEDLGHDDVLAAVVLSIRRFHACPPIPSTFPVFRIVEDYREVAAGRGVAIPPAYDEAHETAGRIEASLSHAPMVPATCHNDLLNANFLREGDHVWLVDYEYAGVGDPFFDLGNLAVNNGLDASAQETLLQHYFEGATTDTHRARLALMRIMSDFREAMWGVVQQAISALDVDYVAYAGTHFDRLLMNASDDRFEDWLAAARSPAT
jgi:thiamine kinase-like enzyme